MVLQTWCPATHLATVVPVLYKTFTFLAYSLKALSLTRRYTLEGLANPTLGEVHLWHFIGFKNSNHLTYYRPTLI